MRLFDRAVFVITLGSIVMGADLAALNLGLIGLESALTVCATDIVLVATAVTLAVIARAENREARTW
jgi:hypothetical protein